MISVTILGHCMIIAVLSASTALAPQPFLGYTVSQFQSKRYDTNVSLPRVTIRIRDSIELIIWKCSLIVVEPRKAECFSNTVRPTSRG